MRYDLNSEKDCKTLSRRIKCSYQRIAKGLGDPEDCIQSIFLRMLEGKGQHQTIDQSVIDYLRATYGDSRIYSDDERSNRNNPYSIGPGDYERLLPVDIRRESSARLDFDECSRFIGNKLDKVCFGLFYKWGLSEAEIGNLFGFSESRVSQRLKRIQGCISARIKSQESRAKEERQRKMEEILCPQAKRNGWRMEQVSFERMEIGQSWAMASFNEQGFEERAA